MERLTKSVGNKVLPESYKIKRQAGFEREKKKLEEARKKRQDDKAAEQARRREEQSQY